MVGNQDVKWCDVAKSVLIFISGDAETTDLIFSIRDHLGPKYRQLLEKSVIIRVSKLPLGAQIEMEILCDSAKFENFDSNYKVQLKK